MSSRRAARPVRIGAVVLGGEAPVAVESMTTMPTQDAALVLGQIADLVDAGCELVRVAIPAARDLAGFAEVCAGSPIPVIADIHNDYRLAIEAARRGAASLRINPGNIGSLSKVDAVIDAAGEVGISIRIGVNAGSLADEYAERKWPLAEKLVASAVTMCEHFESRGFEDIVVSAKASDVRSTIQANRTLSTRVPYPFHIGVTEAGTTLSGTVKSAVGIGTLLLDGIGDTIRVSLTADPVLEVRVGWDILGALGMRRRGPEVISCPTCARCQINLISLAEEVERRVADCKLTLKIAVMGCAVNGPGEAREADLGVAAGKGRGVIFARGQPLYTVPENRILDALTQELDRFESCAQDD